MKMLTYRARQSYPKLFSQFERSNQRLDLASQPNSLQIVLQCCLSIAYDADVMPDVIIDIWNCPFNLDIMYIPQSYCQNSRVLSWIRLWLLPNVHLTLYHWCVTGRLLWAFHSSTFILGSDATRICCLYTTLSVKTTFIRDIFSYLTC